jgi:hypothetical protein
MPRKYSSQDSRSPGRDLNPGPHEYEAGELTISPRRMASVIPGSPKWNACTLGVRMVFHGGEGRK